MSVDVECIAETVSPSGGDRNSRGAQAPYTIAATARIRQLIHDEKWVENASRFSGIDDSVAFEAISGRGVVLGSGGGKFVVVPGDYLHVGTVSAKMNLSAAEVGHVFVVRVGWRYKR
jgi:hypothetical protein